MQPRRANRTQQHWEPFRGLLDTLYNLAFLYCSDKSPIHVKHAQDASLACVSQTPAAAASLAVTTSLVLRPPPSPAPGSLLLLLTPALRPSQQFWQQPPGCCISLEIQEKVCICNSLLGF